MSEGWVSLASLASTSKLPEYPEHPFIVIHRTQRLWFAIPRQLLPGARWRLVFPAFQAGKTTSHPSTDSFVLLCPVSLLAACLGYLRRRRNVESKLISCGFGFHFVESIGEILLAEPGTDPLCHFAARRPPHSHSAAAGAASATRVKPRIMIMLRNGRGNSNLGGNGGLGGAFCIALPSPTGRGRGFCNRQTIDVNNIMDIELELKSRQ